MMVDQQLTAGPALILLKHKHGSEDVGGVAPQAVLTKMYSHACGRATMALASVLFGELPFPLPSRGADHSTGAYKGCKQMLHKTIESALRPKRATCILTAKGSGY